MRKLLLTAAAVLLCIGVGAKADIVGSAQITSDHCNCAGGQTSFGTISATDHENGVIDISISLANGNTFAGGGQDVGFGFNLNPNITISYSNLDTALWAIPGVFNTNQQNAGVLHADGFGNFEYGVDYTGSGASGNPPNSLSFTITGASLSLASFAQLSNSGDPNAFFAFDIFSGTNGNTGFVDCCSGSPTPFAVPGPIVGAGVPGLLLALGGLVGLNWRRRRALA